MRAGELRQRITIERPYLSKTDGVESVTWLPYREVNAAVEQLKAYDKTALSAIYPGADYKITMRYVPGVTSDMRVSHKDMIYSILGQPNDVDGRGRILILTCQSGVKGA